MVKADLLYQLDSRLREFTGRVNQLFGGVALFFFGDIMQLQPVMGKYIWMQPRSQEWHQAYQVEPHWEQFSSISLVENHRQQGDAEYANILNRIRVGEQTDEDLTALQERVRPEGHPEMRGATVIASTHQVVNRHNTLRLQELQSELVVIEAINSHSNIPNYRPRIDRKKQTVAQTPYLQTLSVKTGCRVMLTINLDVKDSLSNGSIGTLQGIVMDKGEVKVLMVLFDNEHSGREARRQHPHYTKRYPDCTPIVKQVHKYTTAKKSRGVQANVATVIQFPLILSFASTTHKIQGQTIEAPRKVAVDLRSVFGASQAYVMLGRVQERSQLYLIGSLSETKIRMDQEAKKQLEILKAKSLNNNPTVWEKDLKDSRKVFSLNIHSLRDKMEDIKADPILKIADMVILSETWLQTNTSPDDPSLQLEGFCLHLNSGGRGKGLAIYYKEDMFTPTQDIQEDNLSVSLIQGQDLSVVGVYRSAENQTLAGDLKETIPLVGRCIVTGDFNICSTRNPDHRVFQELKNLGFRQMVTEATHVSGSKIDHVWLRDLGCESDVKVYSPYYTSKDHDALLTSVYTSSTGEEGTGKNNQLSCRKKVQRTKKREGLNNLVE